MTAAGDRSPHGGFRAEVVFAVAAPAAVVLALHRLGSGRFSAPPVHSWSALTRWYEDAPPEVAAVAILRLVALVLAGWLLVASVLQVLAAAPGLGRVGRVADRISPRSLQRLGRGLAGLSLTAGLAAVVPGAGIPAALALPASTTLAPGGDDPRLPVAPPASPAWPETEAREGTATMRLVDDGSPAAARQDEVTVAVGDSFWSIAADELARRGAPASDRQIVPYWRRLIQHNRAVLVDPGNPDLLYPGQVLTLPPA